MDLFNKKKVKNLQEVVIGLTHQCGDLSEKNSKLSNELDQLYSDLKLGKVISDFYRGYEDTDCIFMDNLKLDVEEFKKFKELMTSFLDKFTNHIHFLPGQNSYTLCSNDGKYLTFKKEILFDNDIDEYPGYILRFSFFDDWKPTSLPTYSTTFYWDMEPNEHTDDEEIMEYFSTLIKFLDECISSCNKLEDKKTTKKSKKKSQKSKTKKKK